MDVRRSLVTALSALLFLCSISLLSAGEKILTFEDVMRFQRLEQPVISADGQWLAYSARPDRGNAHGWVRSTFDDTSFDWPRGTNATFSEDSSWVAFTVVPEFLELEKWESSSGKGKEERKPRPGLAWKDLRGGDWIHVERVEEYAFSKDSRWIAYRHFAEAKPTQNTDEEDEQREDRSKPGTTLVLRRLSDGYQFETAGVTGFSFDSGSSFLTYAVRMEDGEANGVYLLELADDGVSPKALAQRKGGYYSCLTWSKEGSRFGFLEADSEKSPARIRTWDGVGSVGTVSPQLNPGWIIPGKNDLTWTRRGERLFFGIRPQGPEESRPVEEGENQQEEATDPYSRDAILKDRGVDVWHWNDPLIISHQKKRWDEVKEKTYLAVFDVASGQSVSLGDEDLPDVQVSENPTTALGTSDVPYQKEVTWSGRFFDAYVVELANGKRVSFARHLAERPSLSPLGKYAVFYDTDHWYLLDVSSSQIVNLTSRLEVPFADEDHDRPRAASSYGVAGWIEDDSAVLIYDKFDLWRFPTNGDPATNVTGGYGRQNKIIFRILKTDPEQESLKAGQTLLLSSYRDLEKNHGFYSGSVEGEGVERLLEEEKKFVFLGQAKQADRLIFSREDYNEFPDAWVADTKFSQPRKLTDLNPQIKDFVWGEAEQVEWRSTDGFLLRGVLIKPGNFEEGKRYPVLVYYYRFYSQRLYEFNQPVVNHRPCFPLYSSNGYAVFLPDIHFEIGRPGFSATKSLLPGVQKLIDMGVADPDAIALHGHSWSGYQTAYVVTQTDRFRAAIAGAPVSNMTSAYGGIRWESGLARQFQYEQTQSRMGGSLWEYPERYLENSPLFFADRINTPLLIMFGDEDGAVPWYQGIELYLALRRLEKDAVFLQYRGEGHHPAKYPNKLDYAIKMKEYLDHYLKGEAAPEWLSKGIPYSGK